VSLEELAVGTDLVQLALRPKFPLTTEILHPLAVLPGHGPIMGR
jgi:hypothetical protein